MVVQTFVVVAAVVVVVVVVVVVDGVVDAVDGVVDGTRLWRFVWDGESHVLCGTSALGCVHAPFGGHYCIM